MAEAPIVVAEGLSKSFRVAVKQPGLAGTLRHLVRREHRDVAAVQGLSFTIRPGEMVGFLGPNGAGKTTTLKMLSGLIHPSAGRVVVAGCVPFRRQEGFLRQITLVMGNRQQLIWDLPPLDSLRVNAAVYGLNEREARRRIDELAEMLELGEELTRPVRKLSLGQRMKAELLAALLHRPAVLFLDEPTLGLDVNAQVRVRDFLADYNRRTGATVLLTSRLAPCREVRLELRQLLPADTFERYGTVEEHSGHQVRLLIPRDALTERIGALLSRFEVVDLEVRDPPIEELIGRLFRAPAGSGTAPSVGDLIRSPSLDP